MFNKIIEKHLYIASIIKEDYPMITKDGKLNQKGGIVSDLDDLFTIAVPNDVWDKYRIDNDIEDMHISPYYNNDSLKNKKD